MSESFWQTKKLHEMTTEEWDSLCDGCGYCCLNKVVSTDDGELSWTNLVCSQLNCETCQCKVYENRFEIVADCIALTPDNVKNNDCLPPSCAYRLIAEGKDLYWWHHLISGSRETIHQVGLSVRGRVKSDEGYTVEDYLSHVVDWPTETVIVQDNQASEHSLC